MLVPMKLVGETRHHGVAIEPIAEKRQQFGGDDPNALSSCRR